MNQLCHVYKPTNITGGPHPARTAQIYYSHVDQCHHVLITAIRMEIREASFTAPIAVARQVVGCKVAHASGCLSAGTVGSMGDFMVVHPIIRGFHAMGNSELTWKWWEKVVKNLKNSEIACELEVYSWGFNERQPTTWDFWRLPCAAWDWLIVISFEISLLFGQTHSHFTGDRPIYI